MQIGTEFLLKEGANEPHVKAAMNERFSYIARRLGYYDMKAREQRALAEKDILAYQRPVVILAPPGMGKTRLMEKLGGQDGCRFVRASSFLRWPDAPLADSERLVIDGLDEVAAVAEGDPLHNVLKKLLACGRPQFIISCREAEWRNVTASLDISDDYGATPLELNLEPLRQHEAVTALAEHVDLERAQEAVERLNEVGLGEMYANPLTLDFIAAIIEDDGEIPNTRAELYTKAVAQLRKEPNPRHQKSKLAMMSEDEALDAAGAIMAAMLLTGKDSVTLSQSNQDALSVADLGDLVEVDSLRAILQSNLFRLENGTAGTFRSIHRTVSENLAARWLARMVERHGNPNRAAARLYAMITVGDGIPASLRGMAAWLPRFSPMRLGSRIVAADPYAVLRYGDPDNLSVAQARQMMDAFEQLSQVDPYFRRGHWGHLSAKGLVQPALKDRVSQIVFDRDSSYQLRTILLDALEGSELSSELVPQFDGFLKNPGFSFGERFAALSIIAKSGVPYDWPDLIQNLLQASCDEEADRLAVNAIMQIGTEQFTPSLIAQVAVAHSGVLDSETKEISTVSSLYRLKTVVPDVQIIPILDELSMRLADKRDPVNWWKYDGHEAWRDIGNFADHLIRRQLETDKDSIQPYQLWRWMRCLEREEDSQRDDRGAITEILKSDARLRQGVQRLVLFGDADPEQFHMREYHMHRLSLGLALQEVDARLHLVELVERNDPAERRTWMGLVNHFRTDGRIPNDIQKMATPFVGGDAELRDFLTKKAKPHKLDEWEKKHRRKQRDRERRRKEGWERNRTEFSTNIEEVRNGDLKWSCWSAKAYLGGYSDLRADIPDERLEKWLGNELRDACLDGFEAALHRTDLPTPEEVATSFAKHSVWHWVYPLVAGAAVRHRSGQGFNDLSPEVLCILDLAIANSTIWDSQSFEGLDAAVELAIREKPSAYEKLLRLKFEPMFEAKKTHVPELYPFVRSTQDAALATMLCEEWLARFPDLPLAIEEELAACLLHAPEPQAAKAWAVLQSIIEEGEAIFADETERTQFWRSVWFVIDFDTAVVTLPTIGADNRNLLWVLTRFIYSRFREERKLAASVTQLSWLVATFRNLWPRTGRPTGMTHGSDNAWDATDLLNWAIYELAGNVSGEAVRALAMLRAMPEDGYSETIQDAIAQQRRLQIDGQFLAPDLASTKAVILDSAPQSAADVQAIVMDELQHLQDRLRGDPLNIVNNFYQDSGEYKDENSCRDQMLIALGQLPYGIQYPPETAMPQGNRADGAFTYHQMAVPLETKGQWHKEVWTAANSQLDRLYASDYRAGACGIYVVFWFGDAARLQKPPKGVDDPKTPEEMAEALKQLIPVDRRGAIEIVVLDVTRPQGNAPKISKAKSRKAKDV